MKKKVILSVIAVLIIVAAVVGILYYTTDLFKTPEQLFYKHLASSSGLLGEMSYEDMMKELQKEKEASMEVAGEITAKVISDDSSLKELGTVLENGKITYNMKTVGSEQKVKNDITLNYNNNDIVTLSVLQNKEQYGIKVEEAYDKYISVENNNLKALFTKLGIDSTNVPDKIEMVDYYELLNIDAETLKHIETTYSTILTDNIPEEAYSVEKEVVINVNNTDITTNAYKLTLTEEQTKLIFTKMLETLKSDDKTLDLIVNKCNAIVEPYETMGEVDKLTKQELVQEIENELTSLNERTSSENNTLELVVYGLKESKSKIEIVLLEENEQIMKVSIDMFKTDSDSNMILNLSDEYDTIEMLMSYNDKKADVTMKVESDGTTVEVTTKQEVKSTENITVEEFTSDNSVKLNDMTEAEMGQLVQTIYANVMNVLPQKMQLLGIDTTALNSTL